jgi:UDP-N-acetylglucosamine 2-epimerase (non-hydrolysing)/GDP/UDP-N,N'-diacetylbacillosamine 2-epimerase (hydrolysing)
MASGQKTYANVQRRTSNVQHRSEEGKRRICFVTGTRAEYGLMRSTLVAIRDHPQLELQIIATGMHLSAEHGRTIRNIRTDGWKVDATVPWSPAKQREKKSVSEKKGVRYPSLGGFDGGRSGPSRFLKNGLGENENAVNTGRAMAGLASALDRLQSDIVLVVGDRVEAFAAAAAGHLSGRIVAHIHGGDRALGQVDDSLRHAITKLAHLHFPATIASKNRILNLGEDAWRVHRVGSPGIDGITMHAASAEVAGRFALIVLHPTDTDEAIERKRAELVLGSVKRIGFDRIVIVYPNNDPGFGGIIGAWEAADSSAIIFRDVPRPKFLGLLRDAAVLIGNSSAGIIEAASFGTPVVDVGPRQLGRETSANVVRVPFSSNKIASELRRIWNSGKPLRCPKKNVYGGDGTGQRIAEILASVEIDSKLRRKLIAY